MSFRGSLGFSKRFKRPDVMATKVEEEITSRNKLGHLLLKLLVVIFNG